jgi:hypothetical protein
MALDYIPGCCNALVIHGFGGTAAAQRLQYGDNVNPDDDAQESMILNAIDEHGSRMLLAFVNTDQKTAMKLLKTHGFQRTKTMEKQHHPETGLIMYWRRPT